MASTIGINLRVTGHCNQGGRKYMEDAFVVAYQQTENEKDLEYAYFGIFDGHGGREAALFAKEHLMDNIVSQKNFWSDNDELVLRAIKDGFRITHKAMWKELGKWPKTVSGLPSTSGTTASIAFIRQGKMYIGHVGDSRIVLGYQEPGMEKWQPRSLTKDHKPESPAERERIYSVGGCVMNKAGVERVVWYRPRIGHKGPVRRSTHFDQIPFLAVARSLGDLWSYNYSEGEFVVSPEPDVSVVTLDSKKDRCIVLASDGLWNMLSLREAVSIVQEVERVNEKIILDTPGGKPASNPSKLLVDRALGYWCNLNMRADNTSVVTVLMDPPGPPKREVLLRQRVMQKLRPREEHSDCDSGGGSHSESESDEKSHQKLGVKSDNQKPKRKLPSFGDIRLAALPKPVVLTPRRIIVKPLFPKPITPAEKMVPSPQVSKTTSSQKDRQVVENSTGLKSGSCPRTEPSVIDKGLDSKQRTEDENSCSVLFKKENAPRDCKESDKFPAKDIAAATEKCGRQSNDVCVPKLSEKSFSGLKRKLVQECLEKDKMAKKLKSQNILSTNVSNFCGAAAVQHSLTQCTRSRFRTCRVKEA